MKLFSKRASVPFLLSLRLCKAAMVMDDIGRVFLWMLGRFVGPRDEAAHGANPVTQPAAPAPAE